MFDSDTHFTPSVLYRCSLFSSVGSSFSSWEQQTRQTDLSSFAAASQPCLLSCPCSLCCKGFQVHPFCAAELQAPWQNTIKERQRPTPLPCPTSKKKGPQSRMGMAKRTGDKYSDDEESLWHGNSCILRHTPQQAICLPFLLSARRPSSTSMQHNLGMCCPTGVKKKNTAISFSCNNALDPFCLYSCTPCFPELSMPVTRLVFELSFSQSCRLFLCFITKLQWPHVRLYSLAMEST